MRNKENYDSKDRISLRKTILILVFVGLLLVVIFYEKKPTIIVELSGIEEVSNEDMIETKENSDFNVINVDALFDEFSNYVFGKIENKSGKDFNYVTVDINLYNDKEELIGSTVDVLKDVRAGQMLEFKAPIVGEDAYTFEIYEIIGE